MNLTVLERRGDYSAPTDRQRAGPVAMAAARVGDAGLVLGPGAARPAFPIADSAAPSGLRP